MIELNKNQTAALPAIEGFLTNDRLDAFIMRGGAGTGKTTLIGKLVEVFGKQNLSFELLAPTRMAARILGSKVERITGTKVLAGTIHGCIYLRDKLEINEETPDVNDPGMRMFSH